MSAHYDATLGLPPMTDDRTRDPTCPKCNWSTDDWGIVGFTPGCFARIDCPGCGVRLFLRNHVTIRFSAVVESEEESIAGCPCSACATGLQELCSRKNAP